MKVYAASNEAELRRQSSIRAYLSIRQQAVQIEKDLDDFIYQIESYEEAGIIDTSSEDFLLGSKNSIMGRQHIVDVLDKAADALNALADVCNAATDYADEDGNRWFPRKRSN